MRYFIYYDSEGNIIGWLTKESEPIQEGYTELAKTEFISELDRVGVTYPTPLTAEEKKAIRDEMVRAKMAEFYPVLTDEIGILYRGTAEEKALHEERYLAACAEADVYIEGL